MTITPYYADDLVTLYAGDCLDVMRDLPDASVDSVVTDPPYSLGFMSRAWDTYSPAAFQAWCQLWAAECLRVLKPGGHLLSFGGTRTYHRLACAVEDAGFEIRDSITWLYGSGFPKSLDVSRAIDKAVGAERTGGEREWSGGQRSAGVMGQNLGTNSRTIYDAAASSAAQQWQGWGTALKPASEPIVVARKPLRGTVAGNVQAFGTGALNIDAARVTTTDDRSRPQGSRPGATYDLSARTESHAAGRWPPNVVLTHDADCAERCGVSCQVAELDRQSGTLTSGANPTRRGPDGLRTTYGEYGGQDDARPARGTDTGGASRFFPTFRYAAKAPTFERPRVSQDGAGQGRIVQGYSQNMRRCNICGSQTIKPPNPLPACGHDDWQWVDVKPRDEHVAHPTVKPLDLMRWLVRLVTPPGGTVLDPFAGSGTTAEACVVQGFHCIAIEREPTYLPLIVARLSKPIQPDMFGGAA